MKQFYQELHGVELDMSKEDIDTNVRICGIEHEGRVYLPELVLGMIKQKRNIITVDYF